MQKRRKGEHAHWWHASGFVPHVQRSAPLLKPVPGWAKNTASAARLSCLPASAFCWLSFQHVAGKKLIRAISGAAARSVNWYALALTDALSIASAPCGCGGQIGEQVDIDGEKRCSSSG